MIFKEHRWSLGSWCSINMHEIEESKKLMEYTARQVHNIFGLDSGEKDILMSTTGGEMFTVRRWIA